MIALKGLPSILFKLFVNYFEKKMLTYSTTSQHLLGSINETTATRAAIAFWSLNDWANFFHDIVSGLTRNMESKFIITVHELSCAGYSVLNIQSKIIEMLIKVKHFLMINQWEKVNEFSPSFLSNLFLFSIAI